MVQPVKFGGVYIPFLERKDERPVSTQDWEKTERLLKQECHNKHYFHNRPGGVPFWFEDDAMGPDATTYRPTFEKLKRDVQRVDMRGNARALWNNFVIYILKNPLGKMEKLENQLLGKARYLKITMDEDTSGKTTLIKRMF